MNAKQTGQLRRDWYAIMDVNDVRIAPAESIAEHAANLARSRRPSAIFREHQPPHRRNRPRRPGVSQSECA